ncbi:MAG: NACHT domain-containing protein [Ginsengibacter sp.]
MKINRDDLLERLFRFSLSDSGMIVGNPGIGKSYLLKQLRRKFYENKILSFIIKIDDVFSYDDEAINAELEFDANWIDTLKSIYVKDGQKAVLIFDAFDAARDENLRKGFLRQIQRATRELSDKCNIIVSVRSYDASKSPALLRLFSSGQNAEGIDGYRKEEIKELTEKEIVNALNENDKLLSFYKDSSKELKEILKVPFFLVLLESIVAKSTNLELEEIKKYKSETQLLKVFWHQKILDTDEYILKEAFLSKFTNRLLEKRSLNISKNEIFKQFQIIPTETFNYLRSENIIDEVSIENSRLAFSHNILFDYAVSVFCISENYDELLEFIKTDRTRPFFFRPSFIYFFTSLWYQEREKFWIIYWKLIDDGTKEIQLFVRLILNGVISSEFVDVEDLLPLMSNLTNEINKVAIRNVLQSIRFIRSQTLSQDVKLILHLAKKLDSIFLFDFAFLLHRAINAGTTDQLNEKCGEAARLMLEFVLDQRNSENRYFLDKIGARGIELVSKTYGTHSEESRRILSKIFEMQKVPDFEILYFSHLSEYVRFIVQEDPKFVAKIYDVIFGYKETSSQTTHLGSSVIMNFSSNRRQDYELCYFRLEQFYPEFLNSSPILALQTGMKVVNKFIIEEKVPKGLKLKAEKFNYGDLECKYIIDLSSIWAENIHYYKRAEIADKIIFHIEELILKQDIKYESLIHEYIKHAKVGYTWKLLFKLGNKYPSQLAKQLYPLLIVPPLMKGPDTSYEVRELIGNAAEFLTDQEIKEIEKTIFLTYDSSQTYVISSALSRIPSVRIQMKRSKNFISKNGTVANEPGFKSSFSSEAFTSEMWLKEKGVDMSKPQNEKLTKLNGQLEVFNNTWLNRSPDISEYKEILNLAKKCYYEITEKKDEIHEDLFFSVLSSIAKTFSIICRNLSGIDNENFNFLKTAINHLFHFISKYDGSDETTSPSHGWSPTPRIEAAEGLIYLYLYESNEENLLLIKEGIQDGNGIVRFNVARNLVKIADVNFVEYWSIIIERLEKEEDSFIYVAILNNLKFKIENIKKQAVEVLNIVQEKISLFSSQNNFIESFTSLLLWLLRKHKLIEAQDFLLSAYQKPEFCKGVIFEIFKSLHPSYAENDFQHHPENYEQTLDIIKKYITECSRTLHKIKTEDLNPENIELKNCLQIIDEIILRVYFQFGSRPLGQANIKLPIDEENRKAFYFMIKPIFQDIIQLSSEIGTGLITGHTAHYFIQSLNNVLQYDQKDILSMVTSITKYARQTGYTFDSYAIQDVVSITEKILADNRALLLEEESFNNLIDLLDIYINSGWIEALDLLWKLDEVFK